MPSEGLEGETVFVVVAGHYDESQVQGVYRTERAAKESIEKSADAYSYWIEEHAVSDNPETHDPYF